jgi:hypothetical protein
MVPTPTPKSSTQYPPVARDFLNARLACRTRTIVIPFEKRHARARTMTARAHATHAIHATPHTICGYYNNRTITSAMRGPGLVGYGTSCVILLAGAGASGLCGTNPRMPTTTTPPPGGGGGGGAPGVDADVLPVLLLVLLLVLVLLV